MSTKRKAAETVLNEGTTNQVLKAARVRKTVDHFDPSTSAPSTNKVFKLTSSKVSIAVEKLQIPSRAANGDLLFNDHPEFKPNLTPAEVIKAGSFGGTYFRSIHSGVTGITYPSDQWKEFPVEWFEGVNIPKLVTSSTYNHAVNTYGVDCGGDLHMWESSGWISAADPYGWFQWYCRFYSGRRCTDDTRQIARGNGVIGPTGRWRNNLTNKCLASGKPLEEALEDKKISPKVRQLLQHWGYRLTLKDLEAAAKKSKI